MINYELSRIAKRRGELRPTVPRITYAIAYQRLVGRLIRDIMRQARNTITPLFTDSEHTDALTSLANYTTARTRETTGPLNDLLVRASADHTRQFAASVNKLTRVDVRAMLHASDLDDALADALYTNTKLITSVSDQMHNAITNAVMQAGAGGTGAAALEDALIKIAPTARRRVKVIARDQLAKFNLSLSQIRQEQAAITHYKWFTSRDERVRVTHVANDRKTFAWARPPRTTGHPGNDILCRCTAHGVV